MATPEAVEFAALLKDLKDRSGRSYGVLAGKLHVSTSTLHRYCNGDAVPNEFAPVERFARVCGASGDELVEVHRRWIVADAARRRPPAAAANTTATATAAAAASAAVSADVPDAPSDAVPAAVPDGVEAGEPPESAELTTPSAPAVTSAGVRSGDRPGPGSRWARLSRRTRVLIAAAGVAALLVPTTVVAVELAGSGKEGGGSAADRVEDAGGGLAAAPEGSASATPRPSMSASSANPSASASASPSGQPSGKPSAGAGAGQSRNGGGGGGAGTGLGAPPTVSISSYNWEEPCGQHYLVNRGPDELDPPPAPQDRRGWAESYGGVEGGNTRLQLTVQGTSREAVVLKGMNVRVVSRKAPLPWSAYLMGNGCGSGITPQTFASNLDAGHPTLRAVPGTQGDIEVPAVDFPYKVSSEDVEVFNLEMKAVSHDVSWYLELEWSSGGKEGTLRIDDRGKPFRLSGMKGRPEYVHGGQGYGWERAGQP
ncbi:helix-turn-helix domain-containing protein [Streptomyces globisporus]|uniref:Transcriptional regulator n=1 Tax=Streptomyces globisporus TaxID=1908 RepID=A0A423V0X7_STRGL|nr:helix-turn-helix transcriptional regulator [Streptomyces globisporus]ROV68256.1 transcriptional regulator [Streptomyces globisporus]